MLRRDDNLSLVTVLRCRSRTLSAIFRMVDLPSP
jgi:hypothetical protein